MKLLNWIISKITSDKDNYIIELRKEIDKVKKENKGLKEKVIALPQNNKEEVPIKFYDENIEDVIINHIRGAKKEICIAMAWFTTSELMDELGALKRKGINIKIVISEDKQNVKNIYKLSNVCSKLKTAIIPMKDNTKYKNLMHNKYCIIDNKKVIDGSYNWSYHARYNLEHIIVIESTKVAKMYKDSFERIYSNPKYFEDYNIYSDLG